MTDDVAAALAWFWDRPAPGLSADDITHGIVLAREVRRLTALCEAQEGRWVELGYRIDMGLDGHKDNPLVHSVYHVVYQWMLGLDRGTT